MAEPQDAVTLRKQVIGDVGVRIIAREGVRALTHRAVDREAGFPQGSTSYYASTRHALLELIVRTLADQTDADAHRAAELFRSVAESSGRADEHIDVLAGQIAVLVESLVARSDHMRARYALLLELDDRAPLRAMLADKSDVRRGAVEVVRTALQSAGTPSEPENAADLLAIIDGLVFQRSVLGVPIRTKSILTNYLRGLMITG